MPSINLAPLVTVAIPFTRNPHPDWSISLASIVPPMNASHQIRRTINMKRGAARDHLVEQAIKDGSRFILCHDDDVTVPPSILRKLLFQFGNVDDDVVAIGGIYCTKSTPAEPLVFKKIGDGSFYKWKLGEVFECEAIATGMLLIKTEVFKHIPKPWFLDIETVEEAKEHNLIPQDHECFQFGITDDVYFCRKVFNAGYKCMAHGGVLGMHWDDKGTAYLLPDNSYPVKTEYEKRYGKEQVDEKEYWRRIMNIYRDYYGYVDILPIENEDLLYVK